MGFLDIFKKKPKAKRNYQGASKGKRLSRWYTSSGDANSANDNSLKTLRERSRDLRRNNPYAKRGIEVITANVIGKGISTTFQNDATAQLWKEWTSSKSIDFDGKYNLKGLQRLVMDAISESGEVLVRRRITPGLRFPFQLQVLEADFLDTTKTIHEKNKNRVIQGIEFDSNGKLLGYHLYETHPGSIDSTLNLKSNFIPASEVLHLYRQDRPGQVRGVPWLSPVIIKLKDLDEYQDAQLTRQKIAACFTAFVHDLSADCVDDTAEVGDLGEMLEPGIIEELPPGKTVTFASPPPLENYKEFISTEIRAIAIGLGLSYEAFSGDLTETNYSSARMGHLEMSRNVDAWRQHIIINQLLDPVVDMFYFMLSLTGDTVTQEKPSHTPPMREMIDPTKEVPAYIEAIRAGLTSRSKVITSMGDDPDEVHDSINKDNEKADNLGLILDSDPRYTNNSGKIQEGTNSEKNQN